MTKNQIDYANYKENVRHNLVTEGETYRHNYAGESEVHRSNVSVETETHRHNLVTESIGWQSAHAQTISANAAMKQANVAEYLAPSQREMNLTQADLNKRRSVNVDADTSLKGAQKDNVEADTKLKNKQVEKLKYDILKVISETALNKIKTAVESVEYKYREQKLKSEIGKNIFESYKLSSEGYSNLMNLLYKYLGLDQRGQIGNALVNLGTSGLNFLK